MFTYDTIMCHGGATYSDLTVCYAYKLRMMSVAEWIVNILASLKGVLLGRLMYHSSDIQLIPAPVLKRTKIVDPKIWIWKSAGFSH